MLCSILHVKYVNNGSTFCEHRALLISHGRQIEMINDAIGYDRMVYRHIDDKFDECVLIYFKKLTF